MVERTYNKARKGSLALLLMTPVTPFSLRLWFCWCFGRDAGARTQFDKLALHRRGLPLGEREDHSVKPAIRVSILQRQDVNFLACQEAQDASTFVRHGHLGHHARLAPHQLFAVLARENILNRRNVYLRRGRAHIKSQSIARKRQLP